MPVFPSYRNQSIDLCKSSFYMRATLALNGLTSDLAWDHKNQQIWVTGPMISFYFIFLLISKLLCMLNVLNMFWCDFNFSLTNTQASVFTDRSSRPEVFCKKRTLKTFAKFTGKHMPYYYIKKETLAQVFSWELGETFKNTFFI